MSELSEETRTLAIIPARAGSKRVENKNIRTFAGKPLISYSIEAAQRANIFSKIIVSTDSEAIAEIARKAGAETPFVRPPELADDHCPVGAVVEHAIEFMAKEEPPFDYVCCIFATAPMVCEKDIERGLVELKKDDKFRTALAVTTFSFPIKRALRLNAYNGLEMIEPQYRLTRSQDLEECYHDAGQFFWINNLKSQRDNLKGIKPVFVNRYRVQDIDTPEDWLAAECQFRALKMMNQEGMINAIF